MKSAGVNIRGCSTLIALVCLLATSGCRSSDPIRSDDPSVTAASTSTIPPTTEPVASTSVAVPLDRDPPVADVAYAQRVLDELTRLDAEASRILYRDRRVTPEYEAIIRAIYFGESLKSSQQATATDLSLGLTTWQDPPGPTVLKAKRVVDSSPGCIAVLADSDYRARYRTSVPVQSEIGVLLQRNIAPTPEERRINPTLWLESGAGSIASGATLSEACR